MCQLVGILIVLGIIAAVCEETVPKNWQGFIRWILGAAAVIAILKYVWGAISSL